MTQIQDSILQLVNAALENSTGAFSHDGNYVINGTLTVDTINVKNLITDPAETLVSNEVGNWIGNLESELNGKGFNWSWGNGSTQLIYRTGNRLWTNGSFDMPASSAYNIDNVPVLSLKALGPTVQTSNLTKVGTLTKLNVAGDTMLGDFAFFNSTHNRLGIGTQNPNGAIGIIENNVEISIGSPAPNLATIGTTSNHDVAIVTDDQARITVKNSGEVNIGDPVTGGGVLNVYGTLHATNVVTDSRLDRFTSLEFLKTKESSVYGLGLKWFTGNITAELKLKDGSDRIHSTEHFDVAEGKSYLINNRTVLSNTGLGDSVVNSRLTSVGVLESLTVAGAVNVAKLTTQLATIKTITTDDSLTLKLNESELFYGDAQEINIGDKSLQSKAVKVFGQVSVNINNPDPTLSFSVAGDVSLGNKRFTNAATPPNSGTYLLGDICWNNDPVVNSFIGWVCVVSGTPGQWLPFGQIVPR